MQVRKEQLELDMEQQTGFKLGKENIKAVYYHPDCLTYMQSISCETLGWIKHKLESGLLGEISIILIIIISIIISISNNIRYTHEITLMAENEELKSLLMKVKE